MLTDYFTKLKFSIKTCVVSTDLVGRWCVKLPTIEKRTPISRFRVWLNGSLLVYASFQLGFQLILITIQNYQIHIAQMNIWKKTVKTIYEIYYYRNAAHLGTTEKKL